MKQKSLFIVATVFLSLILGFLTGSAQIGKEIKIKKMGKPILGVMITDPGVNVDGNKLPQIERDFIVRALKKHRGSIKKASEMMGLSYKTLQYRMKKIGLERTDFK